MAEVKWNITDKRFVAFFDILGFKDLVANNTHKAVLEKLDSLKKTILRFENLGEEKRLEAYKLDKNQSKSVTFSDSIIFFSKGETFKDLVKILLDSYGTIKFAIEKGLAIKGGISFGEITVDFEQSLFFGQPIIDAYLLHEELQMITAIMDNNFEVKLKTFDTDTLITNMIIDYKANLKSGRITHKLMKPFRKNIPTRIQSLTKLYDLTSGRPRLYIDNTIEFLKSIPE
ncbi:MAG: hypothetical protein EOO06_17065 [Chitinophagaceae bacterium]|nr:MAG: hypothetical protein EOO06_17065 [Chitinophagaceae bacterium]